ncbi:uncharacterized protein LOC124414720 isoform X2 [Diprion similis]|uniref:uncharacterized protein LOC124414720 isoform X2 n=1 Tax=Diprion similis TaxID=362088 RepID=UPI001EF80322|nr:uncharacterized protein LOC124414720 isoform X2 [Diprion similis]
MGKRCCVPDCQHGYRHSESAISLFGVPKVDHLFRKWSCALKEFNIDLKKHHFVCENHFLTDDIISEKVLRDPHRKIIFQRKLNKKRLQNGAVPFASAPCLESVSENFDMSIPTVDPDKRAYENNVTENKSALRESSSEAQNIIQYNKTENESVELKSQGLKENPTVFDDIYNGAVKLKLPDSSWGIHMNVDPIKRIIISQVQKCRDSNEIPTYLKQITLNAQLVLKLFVFNKEVIETAVTTLPEVLSAFENMCSATVCEGGPLIKTYKNVHPKCAYRDVTTDRWRHNACSFITKQSMICLKCRSLDTILRQHLDRKHKLRKVHIVLSPSRKKNIEIIRETHRVQMQASRRNKRKLETIKSKVVELQKIMNEISETNSKEIISKLNPPHLQV